MSNPRKTVKGDLRILTLDGGGVRGALTAQILENLERYLKEKNGDNLPLGQRFDLIAGTSVGAILALSLAMGKSAKETVEHWVGDGNAKSGKIQQIFGKPKSFPRWFFLTEKHNSDALRDALQDWFEKRKLADLGRRPKHCQVLITSTALANPSLRTWKSEIRPKYAGRADKMLADVAYASAAAPTFFRAQMKENFDSPNADGGLCANNPAVPAIVEALGMGYGLDQIRLVSVGTGVPCGMPYDPNKIGTGGGLRWLLKLKPKAIPLIELMMQAQSDLAHQQAKFMLKDRGLYLRIDRQLKFPMTLDEIDKVNLLKAYADLTREDHDILDLIFPEAAELAE